jgi:osmotically-inducible protein OsmY
MLEGRGVLLTGLGVGAGLMYLLDPTRGRRRRALIRDQVKHAAQVGSEAIGAAKRDVENRASGVVERVRGLVNGGTVDDRVLVERVRAALGRIVSHPREIEVDAENGEVILRGVVPQSEIGSLIAAVRRVGGVSAVISELDTYRESGDARPPEGGRERGRSVRRSRFAPAPHLMAGAAGFALTTIGAARRNVPAALVAAAGVGLLARAVRRTT